MSWPFNKHFTNDILLKWFLLFNHVVTPLFYCIFMINAFNVLLHHHTRPSRKSLLIYCGHSVVILKAFRWCTISTAGAVSHRRPLAAALSFKCSCLSRFMLISYVLSVTILQAKLWTNSTSILVLYFLVLCKLIRELTATSSYEGIMGVLWGY